MRSICCVVVGFLGLHTVTAQTGIQALDSVIKHSPFSKFGSSALDAFSGVSGNFGGLGIGTVFKRIAESSQVSEISPENTAYKFLRYATPLFSADTIEQFLASPLNVVDGNSKLSSFFEQTQSIAKKQFNREINKSTRRLQDMKQVEDFDRFYGFFSNVGKDSFLDGKSPEDAATSFLSHVSAFPNTAVQSFLTVPSMVHNISPNSFFAQMRDSASKQNSSALNRRQLQLEDLAEKVTNPSMITNMVTDNIPFVSQFNIQDVQAAFPQPLKMGVQQISSVNPLTNVMSLTGVDNMLSDINPFNRISAVSEQEIDLPTIAGLAPNSKFFSYFRDNSRRINPEDNERRLQGFFDFNSAQEKIAALTFENIAKQAKLSTALKAGDAANLWLSSLKRVVPGDSVRSFLENSDVASAASSEGIFYENMMQAARDRFDTFFNQ